MFWTFLPRYSINTRVTIFTLVIVFASIWGLTFYANHLLLDEMEKGLGEQQYSMVSYMATEINDQLEERVKALTLAASRIDPSFFRQPDALQKLLEQSRILLQMFNAGVFVIRADGTAVAESPVIGRVGLNYLDRAHIATTLKEGKPTIGKPGIGRTVRAASFAITVPIRDAEGRVIGAIVGATDLAKANFLSKIATTNYGDTGGYLIVSKPHRLIVTATEKRLVMQPLPDIGKFPLIDRFVAGYEGSGILVNQLGEERLTATKGIPAANWYLTVSIPSAEAFSPIRKMSRHLRLAAIFLSLAVGGLTWLMLRRQLSPMLATMKALASMPIASRREQPLPVTSDDEIGQLVGAFNRSFLEQNAILNSQIVGIIKLKKRKFTWTNAAFARMLGYAPEELLGQQTLIIYPTLQAFEYVGKASYPVIARGEIFQTEIQYRRKDGSQGWFEMSGEMLSPKSGESIWAFIDISQSHELRESLKQNEERLVEAQSLAKIGSWRVRFGEEEVNDRWTISREIRRIYGHPDELQIDAGTGFRLMPPEDQDFTRRTWAAAKRGEGLSSWQHRIVVDGKIKWLQVTAKFVFDEQGRALEASGTNQDITERKHGEDALIMARQQAEAANIAKSHFLAAVSHDLRQPLYAAQLFLDQLKASPRDNDQRELITKVQQAHKAASHQLRLYLELSRLEDGSRQADRQEMSTIAFLEDLADIFPLIANKSNVRLVFHPGAFVLHTDKDLLFRLVSNLIDNAIKFSPGGTVLVCIRRRQSGHLIQVRDNGKGIAGIHHGAVFDDFFQIENAERNPDAGYGLGLSIVSKIALLLGCKVHIASSVGRGSVFSVVVPD